MIPFLGPIISGATWLGKNLLGVGDDKPGLDLDNLIKAIVAGKGVKDLIGGDDEESDWATFEDEFRGGLSLDPRNMLGHGVTSVARQGDSAVDRASVPVRLRSSIAQQPPQFQGGGLPMPIGLTGMDPAWADPSLLGAEGVMTNRDPFQGLGNLMSGDPLADAEAALELLRDRG